MIRVLMARPNTPIGLPADEAPHIIMKSRYAPPGRLITMEFADLDAYEAWKEDFLQGVNEIGGTDAIQE